MKTRSAIEALSRVLQQRRRQLHIEFSQDGKGRLHVCLPAPRGSALTEEGAPTDLRLCGAGLSLRHILIDEFQDTSIAQFDLLDRTDSEVGAGRWAHAVRRRRPDAVDLPVPRSRGRLVPARLRARASATFRWSRCSSRGTFARRLRWSSGPNSLFAQAFPAVDDVRASAVAFTPSLAARESPRTSPFVEPQPVSGWRSRRPRRARSPTASLQIREVAPDATRRRARRVTHARAARHGGTRRGTDRSDWRGPRAAARSLDRSRSRRAGESASSPR